MATYFEDVELGERREFGEYEVTKDEIVEFAEQYDPQPFHVDEARAEQSMFEGLIASGWHTASMCMRLLVDNRDDRAYTGARGLDRLRWIRPVRPNDVLSVRTEVVEKRPSESDETIGYVNNEVTGYNQDGQAVISWIGLAMVRRRDE